MKKRIRVESTLVILSLKKQVLHPRAQWRTNQQGSSLREQKICPAQRWMTSLLIRLRAKKGTTRSRVWSKTPRLKASRRGHRLRRSPCNSSQAVHRSTVHPGSSVALVQMSTSLPYNSPRALCESKSRTSPQAVRTSML